MRKSILAVAVGVGLFLVTGVGAAEVAKSGYWERTITVEHPGASVKQTVKTYWEGNNKRKEQYTIEGILMEIKKGSDVYAYSPADKKAIKLVVPGKKVMTVQDELSLLAKEKPVGKKVGTASVAGISCDVYQGNVKGISVKQYVSKDSRFPGILKSVTSKGSASETVATTGLRLNYNVPDSMFALPKGTKIEVQEIKPNTKPANTK